MSMKALKPLQVRTDGKRPDGFEICPVADKWTEFLPPRVPLRFSFFRYLGFYVVQTKAGKSAVVRGRAIASVRVTIRNEDKIIFSDRVAKAFGNGVYYVQMIKMDQPGVHTVTVDIEGALADQVPPLVLRTEVFEFMTLDECEDLKSGAYASLRAFVIECERKNEEEELRCDDFQEAFLAKKTTQLRRIDAKWWLKTYVEHTLDRTARQRLLQVVPIARTSHKRKQDHPVRAADKKEHDNLFKRRPRDWKRVRNGEMRMFTTEPLHASATVTIFSAKELYRQLSQYAQV